MTTAGDATFSELDPVAARELLDGGALLLDVREPDEWEAGRAPQAIHIPLGDLEARYQEIPSDRTIVCVCRGGGRSARAAGALAEVGYTTVNLSGGMRAWAEAELPVVTETGSPGEVI
jgi:rhodanese-related sulfurtransferase